MNENKLPFKEKLNQILNSNRFYAVFSILLAVICWLSLSLSDETDATRVIYDVPVQLEYNAAAYQSFGLEIIGQDDITVDVTVEGPRNLIYSLTEADILVYPNVNSVTSSGTKNLRLLSSTVNASAKYAVTHLSQESITLRFDTIVSQKYLINVDTGNIALQDGFLLKNCMPNPVEMTVTGPSQELASIVNVQAKLPGISPDTPMAESCLTQGVISLLDSNGMEVDRSLLSLDYDQVEVTVNVLRRAQQPLKVQFLNVPQGFDITTLGVQLDHDSIAVAVPTTYSEELDAFVVGYLDFNEFDYRDSYTFPLSLPEEYLNCDNVQSVTVTCDTEAYQTKAVTVKDLRLVNLPEDMKATLVTKNIYNVQLVGPADAIELLNSLEEEGVLDEYIYGRIDAGKIGILSGQQNMAVQITLPSLSSVFATGSYTAVVSVE